MKPAVVDKDDFECRDISNVIAYLGFFGLSRFWWEDKISDLVCQLSTDLHKLQIFGRNRDGRNQASRYGLLGVSISRWNIINSSIWNIGLSVFHCKKQTQHFFHRERFLNLKVFDWDLDERNEACSYGWQMRMSFNIEKIYFWDVFLWNFRTIRIPIQRTKSRFFT